MSGKKNWLIIFILFSLTGCSAGNSTDLPAPTIATPTKQISPPTPTQRTTNTPTPCPPHLETELPNPDIPENYIGKVFHVLPEELEDLYGGLIDFTNTKDTEKQYAFTEIINTSINQRMLWFQRELCKDSEERTFFEIIDVIALPFNRDHMVMEPDYCMQDGIIDPEIFALGSRELNPKNLEIIDQAWRANRATEKIEEISIDGVECFGEGVATEDATSP